MLCFACKDDLTHTAPDLFYKCDHCSSCLCLECFGVYITHSSSNVIGAVGTSQQISCFNHDCSNEIVDADVRRILNHPTLRDKGLWEKYLKVQIHNAFQSRSEILITCAFCNDYAELYHPPDPGFWEKVSLLYQQKMDTELSELLPLFDSKAEEKFGLENKRQEVDDVVMNLRQEIINATGMEDDVMPALFNIAAVGGRQAEFDDFVQTVDIESFRDRIRDLSIDVIVDFVNEYAFQELNDEEFDQLKMFYALVSDKSNAGNEQKEEIIRVEASWRHLMDEKRKFIENEVEMWKREFVNRVKYQDVMRELNNEEKLANRNEISESEQFFVCKNPECTGMFCFRCESFFQSEDVNTHVCRIDAVLALYNEILVILAENHGRRCPLCGITWMKDLECTQMTCDHCGNVFCYVCGKSLSDLGEGGFRVHNQWSLGDNSEDRCPLYLQYKYGDYEVPESGRMEGDPERAFQRFHHELQSRAIAEKQMIVDPELWDRMLKEKFPTGILLKRDDFF